MTKTQLAGVALLFLSTLLFLVNLTIGEYAWSVVSLVGMYFSVKIMD